MPVYPLERYFTISSKLKIDNFLTIINISQFLENIYVFFQLLSTLYHCNHMLFDLLTYGARAKLLVTLI